MRAVSGTWAGLEELPADAASFQWVQAQRFCAAKHFLVCVNSTFHFP